MAEKYLGSIYGVQTAWSRHAVGLGWACDRLTVGMEVDYARGKLLSEI